VEPLYEFVKDGAKLLDLLDVHLFMLLAQVVSNPHEVDCEAFIQLLVLGNSPCNYRWQIEVLPYLVPQFG
jgi:hypothetical protein